MWLLFIIIAVVIAVIAAINTNKKNSDFILNAEKELNSYLKENNIQVNLEYSFKQDGRESLSVRLTKYIVDLNKESICFIQKEKGANVLCIKIPFHEIIGCKIYRDDEVIRSLESTIVGGILAGEVGAIIGSNIAQNHVNLYKIDILRKNIVNPSSKILLINSKTDVKSNEYRNANDFVENVYASIQAILNQQEKL